MDEIDLMKPSAQDLAEAGVAAWNIEFKGWSEGDEGVWMDTLSDVLRAWGQLALLPGIDITRSMVMGAFCWWPTRTFTCIKAERKPWLAIAQAPLTDLISADKQNYPMRVTQFASGLGAVQKRILHFGEN